jgi:hypothetical protein
VTEARRLAASLAPVGRHGLAALLAALVAGCGGCGVKATGGPPGPPAARRAEDGVRPVYETAGPADPRAARLCQALYALPEERRATCCGSRPGLALTDACAGLVSAALGSGALLLESARVDACTLALGRAYAGCEWVGPFGPAFPKECQGLFRGQRTVGETCRSSLECASDLLCAGAGPTDEGRCAPAGGKGASCSTSVDALATYTRQDVDSLHPQCQGLCRRHRCEDAATAGAACETSQQCRPGHHCADGLCLDGLALEGQRCWGGDCAEGLRCLNGKCFAPQKDGAACSSDFECMGGCLAVAGHRRCGMRCDLR